MKNIGITVILLSLAVYAVDKLQPLNVKTGLWEATRSVVAGQRSLPEELLSKLTPEQRARYEARVKANSGDKPRTFTSKSCVTKEDLDRGTPFKDEPGCTQKVLSSTASKLQLQVSCEGEGMTREGTISIEALGSETVTGSGNMTVSTGGHTMNSTTSFKAKWLGPTCGDIN